jgi:xylulokinase
MTNSSYAKLALGMDIGTGSTKIVLIDDRGQEITSASAPHRINSPQVGWLESDASSWWHAVHQAMRALPECYRNRTVVVGLSGQMHGVVLTRENGSPIRPAILWADQRAISMRTYYDLLPHSLSANLMNPFVPGMTGPLLLWLNHYEKSSLEEARWVMQAKDWVRLRLTEKALTERSDASGTLLWDMREDRWAEEIVHALGISYNLLPQVVQSTSIAGTLKHEAADSLGLPPGIPVIAGAADTAAGMVGNYITRPGQLQIAVGTGAQVTAVRSHPHPSEELSYHLFAGALSNTWYALAAVQGAGLILEWIIDRLDATWEEVYAALIKSPPGSRGVCFIPHLAGARSPRMSPSATGGFFNLELRHERSDLLRAALEGVAFSIKEAAVALPEFPNAAELHLVGGGSIRKEWKQLLADTLAKRLISPATHTSSAAGAALLAAEAVSLLNTPLGNSLPHFSSYITEPHVETVEQLSKAYDRWCEMEQKSFS